MNRARALSAFLSSRFRNLAPSSAQDDTSCPQGDTFARKVTRLVPKVTVPHRKVSLSAPKVTLSGFWPFKPCHKCQPPAPRPGLLAALALLALTAPATAQAGRESLGVFGQWAAFRDPGAPRCYAIAEAEEPPRRQVREQAPYATVGTWPRRGVRGQVHWRLSRSIAQGAAISLRLGGRRFALTGSGGNAWTQDERMDAAIVAAMRSASSMSVTSRDRSGRRFTDRYSLQGAATAIDAAAVGCARVR
jgi:hypothetical protein